MIKWLLGALLLLAPSLALAQNQGQIVPSGSFTSGHTARCQNSTCTVAVDGGGAAGSNKNGQGYLTEIGITNTGTPLCISDALINVAGGYHQFCLGANALGGGLISYNAYGSASPLALTFNINGTNYPFPGNGNGNVMGPNSSTVNNLSCYNNITGSLLKDCAATLPTASALDIERPAFTNPGGGVNSGLRLNTSNVGGLSTNPAAGGVVVESIFVDNTGGRSEIWAFNPACIQQPISAGGGFGINHCVEIDVVQSQTANVPTDPFSAGAVTHGIELVASQNSSASPQNPQNAIWIWSAGDNNTQDWNFGVVASRVNYSGFACAPYSPSGGDTGTYFTDSCIKDTSSSTRFANIGGTHSIIFDLSGTTSLAGVFVKGLASADSNLLITNVANHSMTLDIDSGAGTPQTSGVVLSDNGTAKWLVEKNNGNAFIVFNEATSTSDILIDGSTDAITLGGTVNFGGAINFHTSTTGAVTPAFTNAPTGCTNVQWIGPLTIASPSLTNVYLASCHS